MHFAFIEGVARWVVVQFDKRIFPRGLMPFQFTAPFGAAEQAAEKVSFFNIRRFGSRFRAQQTIKKNAEKRL
jgi:hypothetical protein